MDLTTYFLTSSTVRMLVKVLLNNCQIKPPNPILIKPLWTHQLTLANSFLNSWYLLNFLSYANTATLQCKENNIQDKVNSQNINFFLFLENNQIWV